MAKKDSKEVSLIKSYKNVFSTESGKKVMFDLMERFGMLHAPYNPESNKVLYTEGQRSVVLHIMSMKDTDPKALELLMQEAVDNINE